MAITSPPEVDNTELDRTDLVDTTQAGTSTSNRKWWALGVIALAQLMVVLDATIITIALPFAQTDLEISDANRQWALTAYTLLFGGLLLLGGRMADYLGRRKMFLIGLAGFALSSAAAGFAWNGASFFAGRALQGVFAAMLAPAALSLITVTFVEQKERARALAVYAGVSGGGAAIGLIAGGALTEFFSWRWTLLINTPIALVAAIGGLFLVVKDKPSARTGGYDLPGAVTVTAALVSLVYGFTKAAESGWGAASTVSLLIAGVVLLAVFIAIEMRVSNPLLPLRIPGEINRGGAFLISFIVPIPMFAMFLFLSYYFQKTLGETPLRTGVLFLPFPVFIVIGAGVASSLLPRFGPRALLVGGSGLATAGLLYLAQLDVDSTWLVDVLPAMILIAAGMGLVFVSMQTVALHRVDADDSGVASALVNTTQQIGGSIGLALLSTIVAQVFAGRPNTDTPAGLKEADIFSYDVAFYSGAGFMAVALVVALFTIRMRKEDLADESPDPLLVG